jgi:hypothetical protein
VRTIAEIQREVEYRETQAARYAEAAEKELAGDAPFKAAAAKAWAEQAKIELAKARALLWALGSDER